MLTPICWEIMYKDYKLLSKTMPNRGERAQAKYDKHADEYTEEKKQAMNQREPVLTEGVMKNIMLRTLPEKTREFVLNDFVAQSLNVDRLIDGTDVAVGSTKV
jgi:hypothetical protein